MMKIKQILLSFGAIAAVFAGTFVYAAPAYALECEVLPQFICDGSNASKLENSGTWLLLIFIINLLSAGVGLVAVAMIAYAAFLYTSAQSDENQTKKAKEMIRNVVIGVAVYALMWAAIQWLVPGGVFAS